MNNKGNVEYKIDKWGDIEGRKNITKDGERRDRKRMRNIKKNKRKYEEKKGK